MRKVQLLLVCLMLSVAAFAADKVIKLPKPNLNRTGAVMKALSERHSTALGVLTQENRCFLCQRARDAAFFICKRKNGERGGRGR